MRVPGSRIRSVAFLAAVFLLAAPAAEAALITPVRIVAEPGSQYLPFANDDYIAWSANTPSSPNHTNAFYRARGTDGRSRVNPIGTEGFTGGFEPGTGRLIYQQIGNGQSDIYFFNPATRERTKAGGVNSGWWEWGPRVSSAYILFARDLKINGGWNTELLLFKRANGVTRRLGRWSVDVAEVLTGTVGDRWASWTVCRGTTCNAFVYNADTRVTRKIPTVGTRPQYAPAVDEINRVVYYVRSGYSCGANVNIFRLPLNGFGGTPVKIVELADGVDTGYEMSLARNPKSGKLDLYFQRIPCSTLNGDIYAAKGVGPA